MKPRLLALVALGCLFAAAQNTAIFPARPATTADLGVVRNGAATTLATGINSSATSVPVISSRGFAVGSFATIDGEIIRICGIPDKTHFNVGVSSCPNRDGRGIDTANGGGEAASHLANAAVQGRIVAWHVNQPAAEIVAIENKLAGPRTYGAKGDGSTDDTFAVQSALNSGNGTLPLTAGTYIIGSTLKMSVANQRIFCEPGATLKLKSGFGGPLITVTGSGDAIQGCTFDANSQSTSLSGVVYFNRGSNLSAENNRLTNASGVTYGFRFSGVNKATVSHNQLSAGLILFDDGAESANVVITGNVIDASGARNRQPIQVAQNRSANIHDYVINDNVLTAGPAAFCITVGQVSGGIATAYGFTINGNTCHITGTSPRSLAYGGFSLAKINQTTFSANKYYARGQYTDIAGLEAVFCNDCTISGNSLYGSIDNTSTADGMNLTGTPMTVSGNVIDGWGGGQSASDGILFYTQEAVDYTGVTLTGNTLVEGTTHNTQAGLGFSCRTARANIQGPVIVGNNFVGNGGNQAINFAASSSCGISYPIVSGNQVSSWTNGVLASRTTNVLQAGNSYNTVANRFNDAGNNSFQTDNIGGYLGVNKSASPLYPLDVNGAARISGLLRSSGGQYLQGGTSIGKTSAAVQALDVMGTSNFSNLTCWSNKNNGVADCTDATNEASPIAEWDGGDGTKPYRGRVQMKAGGTFWIEAVDGGNILLGTPSANELNCSPTNCIIGQPFGFASIPTCTPKLEGAIASVNDSTTDAWGAAYTRGGGTNHVGIRCNGTSWTVYAK